MALVNYGSSDDGSSDEEMDTDEQIVTIVPKSTTNKSDGIKKTTNDDTFINLPSTYLKFDILPEPQESSIPPPVSTLNFPEEIGPIPPKKIYDENEIEKPPGQNDNNNIKIMASSSSFASSLTAQKTARGVMRISAPSLKDLMDDDEDDDKKPKSRVIQPSKKGSGLFAILPEPKQTSLYDPFKKTITTTEASGNDKINNNETSTLLSSSAPSTSTSSYSESTNPSPSVVPTSSKKSLIPHAVQQALLGKRPIPTRLDEIKSKYLKQEANVRIVSKGNKKKHDSDDSDEDSSSDFFSFASASEVIPEDPSLRIPEYVTPSLPQPSQVDTMEESYEIPTRQQQPDIDVMPYIPKGKKSKGEKINFIEVNADDLKPEPQEWLKQVSAEAPVQRRQKDGPGGMQKRKHQITYLAFQAKEREQELKNEWSNNKMTKRATQSKYGF